MTASHRHAERSSDAVTGETVLPVLDGYNPQEERRLPVYLMMLDASSASGSAQYLLAKIRQASADSIWKLQIAH